MRHQASTNREMIEAISDGYAEDKIPIFVTDDDHFSDDGANMQEAFRERGVVVVTETEIARLEKLHGDRGSAYCALTRPKLPSLLVRITHKPLPRDCERTFSFVLQN